MLSACIWILFSLPCYCLKYTILTALIPSALLFFIQLLTCISDYVTAERSAVNPDMRLYFIVYHLAHS